MLLTSYTDGLRTKLSGAATASVIAPSAFLRTFPNAPVFILLGDSHFSFSNKCPNEFLDMASMEFFTKLCALLQPGEKIDYYYEGSDLRKGGPSKRMEKNDDPMADMWKLILFITSSKEKYDKSERGMAEAKNDEDTRLTLVKLETSLVEANKLVASTNAKYTVSSTEYNVADAAFQSASNAEKASARSKLNDAFDNMKKASQESSDAIAAYVKLENNIKKIKERKIAKNPITAVFNSVRWQAGDIRFWNKLLDGPTYSGKKHISMQLFLHDIKRYMSVRKIPQKYYILAFKAIVQAHRDIGITLDPVLALNTEQVYAKYIDNPLSMVHYQVNKIPDNYRLYFKEKLKLYISYVLNQTFITYGKGFNIDEYFLKIKTDYDIILRASQQEDLSTISTTEGELYDAYAKTKFHLCDLFAIYAGTIEPDLYILARSFARMLVPPIDGYSAINIIYYGYYHTQHMHHFFTEILTSNDYTLISYVAPSQIKIPPDSSLSEVGDTTNRCLELLNPRATMPLSYVLQVMRNFKSGKIIITNYKYSIYDTRSQQK